MVGTAVAARAGYFYFSRFLLAWLESIFIQAGTNLTNVYYNYKAASASADPASFDPRGSSSVIRLGLPSTHAGATGRNSLNSQCTSSKPAAATAFARVPPTYLAVSSVAPLLRGCTASKIRHPGFSTRLISANAFAESFQNCAELIANRSRIARPAMAASGRT